jgi:CBS domain-containing protein
MPWWRNQMLVGELLGAMGRETHNIAHDITVDDAVHFMAEKKAGALIIVEGGNPVGIFTESDLLRACVKCGGRLLAEIAIGDVMTNKLIVAGPGDEVAACIGMMLQTNIGCLPVEEDGKILGTLFLRDLMQYQIELLTVELNTLHEYFSDLQDAGAD